MQKLLFIINPISGGRNKDAIIRMLDSTLDRNLFSHETVLTTHAGHATELARRSDADIVVAVGGDGTVSEVAQGLIGTGKSLGIIPCGSGDGLALHLGISRNPRKALRTLTEGRAVTMDCGLIDGRPFSAPPASDWMQKWPGSSPPPGNGDCGLISPWPGRSGRISAPIPMRLRQTGKR